MNTTQPATTATTDIAAGDTVALDTIPGVTGTVELLGEGPDGHGNCGPYALVNWGEGCTSPEKLTRLVLAS